MPVKCGRLLAVGKNDGTKINAFEEGDFVVYPTHGVGRILGTEEREVAGTTLECWLCD